LGPIKKGSVAMTTLKSITPKTGSLTLKHLSVRLQKIRSLKTNALKPLKFAPAATRSQTKPTIKSIVPYGLVVASLVLSGVTASEAHAADVQAKTHRPAHVVTHVARRHIAPAQQQPDFVAQFFQGLFGGPQVATGRGSRSEQGQYVGSDDSPTYDMSPPPSDNSQASVDADVQAIQQMNDENALNASMQAAEQQNDAANAATLQTEINAGM
jgi:hypothetical protein